MPPLLDTVDDPALLRRLPRAALTELARELRAFLLRSVAATGGHLASNLGTVELTLALHYVFDTPSDALVWDVGHQSYVHKILTGRRAAMGQLRRAGGPSGFPRREESTHDAFGTAQSSTSISAALGIAVASRLRGEARKVVAVIGDGGLSAGMAFEALNHAGALQEDLLVVLNDNGMSISESVGALETHLAGLRAGASHGGATLFDRLGVTYTGPVDGHDVHALVDTLTHLRAQRGARLLHVVTQKGRGYPAAERDPILYHGVGRFDPATGIIAGTPRRTYADVFGDWLCDAAARDARVVCITPAMREGSGLVRFAREYPRRYFDVAIAEQHALTFAAGLACSGLKPVVAIYSTFLQRAYDQLVHDIALQRLPVLLAIDRAGVVGADGATHTGAFDLTYLRCVPNMTVMAPADEGDLRRMLDTGLALGAPAAVRYPRGSGPGVREPALAEPLPVARAMVRRHAGQRPALALLAFGSTLAAALRAGERLDATVVDMRFVKPLDDDLLLALAREHTGFVTIEENVVSGGAGSAVAESLQRAQLAHPCLHLGLPDAFLDHGDPESVLRAAGLDADGIVEAATSRFGRRLLHAIR